mgnify:CR=1 FL=1
MVDNISKEERGRVMSLIRSKGTKPELLLKKGIRGLGFSYHPKIKGSPDFANRRKMIAIFLHGCFWHGCSKHCRVPATNVKYWKSKIKRNKERDQENEKKLRTQGYKIITVWEHDLKEDKMIRIRNRAL